MSLRRVTTAEDKEMVGAAQVDMLMHDPASALADDWTVQVGDTAYSKPAYLHSSAKHDNLVTIARARSNRVFYRCFVSEASAHKSSGHPRWYADRFDLQEPSTWHEPDAAVETTHVWRRGHTYQVKIEIWRDMLMTGKRTIPMHKHPFPLVPVRFLDEEDTPVFQ